MKVKECMCGDVCSCNTKTKVNDAAKMMNERKIGCIPVCDDDNCVVGILTDRDITLRTVACDKDVCNTCVGDVMSNVTTCCDCNEDLDSVTKTMSENGVRRIPVTENGKLVGILTLGDLAKHKDVSCNCLGNTFEHICNCKNKNY